MWHRAALRVFSAMPRFLKTVVIRRLYPTSTTGTSVCITNSAHQILLVTHSYSPGWGMPGGFLGPGESPRDAAARELSEELDLVLELTDPPVPFQSPGRRHWNMLFQVVLERAPAQLIRSHSPEVVEVQWHPLDALPDLAEFNTEMLVLLGVIAPVDSGPS